MKKTNKIIIFAPANYRKLDIAQKKAICNGCGAKGGVTVPSTFYGLDISEACNVHDFMYSVGTTAEDKDSADRTFLNNMTRIITARSNWFLKPLRLRRAKTYYQAVHYFGGSAYWDNKNTHKEKVVVL
ncbi:MAG: hypothetical protein DRG78_17305 [Epsilonproteobacteria bacterium]|nr:MAG: hypothetical protein DRG78_17305 [Campylobacterota bacterium]